MLLRILLYIQKEENQKSNLTVVKLFGVLNFFHSIFPNPPYQIYPKVYELLSCSLSHTCYTPSLTHTCYMLTDTHHTHMVHSHVTLVHMLHSHMCYTLTQITLSHTNTDIHMDIAAQRPETYCPPSLIPKGCYYVYSLLCLLVRQCQEDCHLFKAAGNETSEPSYNLVIWKNTAGVASKGFIY